MTRWAGSVPLPTTVTRCTEPSSPRTSISARGASKSLSGPHLQGHRGGVDHGLDALVVEALDAFLDAAAFVVDQPIS
ncbi:hypothetical protein ACWERW_21800 [Streptomyces sp. NPDC004012]